MKVFIGFGAAILVGLLMASTFPPAVVQESATGQLMNLGRHGPCKIAAASVGSGAALTLTDGGVLGRTYVSVQNQTAATSLYCTFDGLTTPTTSLGVKIGPDALYSDNLSGEINVQCISSGTSTVVIQECK